MTFQLMFQYTAGRQAVHSPSVGSSWHKQGTLRAKDDSNQGTIVDDHPEV